MAVNAKAVIRVIIQGEWIWVERGTFDVVDFEFEDDDGNLLNRAKEPAYFFVSTNGDPYYGPLASISLMKLDLQLLDGSSDTATAAKRPHALGPGDDDSLDAGPSQAPPEPPDDAEPEVPRKPKSVPLFADDLPPEDEAAAEPAEPSRRGGLL